MSLLTLMILDFLPQGLVHTSMSPLRMNHLIFVDPLTVKAGSLAGLPDVFFLCFDQKPAQGMTIS